MEQHEAEQFESLKLEYHDVDVHISIPSPLSSTFQTLRHEFNETLISGKLAAIKPNCMPEFLACFNGFVQENTISFPTESSEQLLKHLWHYYDDKILNNNDIHVLAATYPSGDDRQRLIKAYYAAKQTAAITTINQNKSALLRAQAEGHARVYGIFGGQGNTKAYFEELRNVYHTYRPFVGELITLLSDLLESMAQDPKVKDLFPEGLDVLHWLDHPEHTPSDYLLSAPLSFPLIGLLQLAYVKAIGHCLDISPHDFSQLFSGLAGHSQGIVVATSIATAETWSEFQDASVKAITILFWIGARSQQVFRETPLPSSKIQRAVENGQGTPSPMLAVSNIPKSQLEKYVNGINRYLSASDRMQISLINSQSSFVISGPQRSLTVLADKVQSEAAHDGQERVPFSERKSKPSIHFLPVTVPFHCDLLSDAISVIQDDLRGVEITPSSLKLSVNRTNDAEDLNSRPTTNLVPDLIRMLTTEPVTWTEITFSGATHVIDFGPGGSTGVGVLAKKNNAGLGTRLIITGVSRSDKLDFGSLAEIFDSDDTSISWEKTWSQHNSTSLVRTAAGTFIDSKLSRLLGLPPFIVAGMTPTTTHHDFVCATMQAGYHIELAGGGYRNAKDMTAALTKLRGSIPAGRGITVNVIYINPSAIAWQIPLIRKLRSEGFPITGMTIGGGVPSIDVASDYIRTLGLEHISFKPGSVSSIRQVIEIAKENSNFPVILQWTGGRGGGHHSFEDFHSPILETYQEIRQCGNIILVAGSGFGSDEDVYPYLTGTWSLTSGKPAAMPFDGFLFGSRVMACKEAHTSDKVKTAIVAAEGINDNEWELTYKGSAGGIISVTSEMGQPVHVLATRGACFWAEMDRMVFKLQKKDRVKILNEKRSYIISRLNADFQKVWFAQKELSHTACELGEMTYAEVLRRMVRLMFVESQARWIDVSYRKLLVDFLVRTEERFAPADATTSMIQDTDGMKKPFELIESVLEACPEARHAILSTEDEHYFLHLCRRPDHKPVPFVPALDDNFETWFKKDSLWQSEDLDAVMNRDAGRTFVLHGPVATKQCREVNESIKDIMDSINSGVIGRLLHEKYEGDESTILHQDYIGQVDNTLPEEAVADGDLLILNGVQSSIDVSAFTSTQMLSLLAGRVSSWRYALFASGHFAQLHSLVDNPIRTLVSSLKADLVEITHHADSENATIALLKKTGSNQSVKLVEFEKMGNLITVNLYTWNTPVDSPVALPLKFEYHPEAGYAPIREIVDDKPQRIRNFYELLWLGKSHSKNSTQKSTKPPDTAVFEDTYVVDEACVKNFNRAIGYDRAHKDEQVPMDFGIVMSWKPVSRALLQMSMHADLLNLVHLSNSFEIAPDASPIAFGDKIKAVARIDSVKIEESGKVVEVACKLLRSGVEAMTVTSRFLFRGKFDDFSSTFSRTVEKHMQLTPSSATDVAILSSKPWFRMRGGREELLGAELIFKLQTFTRYQSKTVYTTVETTGEVLSLSPIGELRSIGSVYQRTGVSSGNPVTSYLLRHGKPVEKSSILENAIRLSSDTSTIKIPESNARYSQASGDFNPIHTSPVFASYAKLPGTITHGMYCSAAVRQMLETYAAEQSPQRVRKYEASFVGMVLPGDILNVSLEHTGMIDGLKVVKIDVRKQESGEKVLIGEALVAQPPTTIIFTGQGSQDKSMGMDLYETSEVARKIWDKADAYFETQFGLKMTDIVRNNPIERRVYFGGIDGRILRENYMSMVYEVLGPNGTLQRKPIFPDIDEHTMSYCHSSPKGLLFATQFAQPALVIMELASFKDMEAKGVVPTDSSFAGHSLGEYSALAAVTDFMPFERLLYLVFCRGSTMQAAVERDSLNRSSFGMVAVDPSRVSKCKRILLVKLDLGLQNTFINNYL